MRNESKPTSHVRPYPFSQDMLTPRCFFFYSISFTSSTAAVPSTFRLMFLYVLFLSNKCNHSRAFENILCIFMHAATASHGCPSTIFLAPLQELKVEILGGLPFLLLLPYIQCY